MTKFLKTYTHPLDKPDNRVEIASRTRKQVSGTQPDSTRHPHPASTQKHVQDSIPLFVRLSGRLPDSRVDLPDTWGQVSGCRVKCRVWHPTLGCKCRVGVFSVWDDKNRHGGGVCVGQCRVVSGKAPDTLKRVLDEKNRKVSGCRVGGAYVFFRTPQLEVFYV